MHDIVKPKNTVPTEFDPLKTKERISVLEAAIRHAQEMEEWEAGMKAAGWMVAEINAFVAWWKASVRNQAKRKKSQPCDFSVKQAEKETGIKDHQVSRWYKELNRPGYELRGIAPSHKKFLNKSRLSEGRAGLQTGEMEWFTPEKYIEMARAVLGGIDLDPASCEAAQKTVKAAEYFTVETNGLKQKWKGRIWLNPPYAGALVAAFADKMLDSVSSGEVTAAIMLTNAYTETSWFHKLAEIAAAVCFTRGRIKFESPQGEKCAPTNGQCFFYFGEEMERFKSIFFEPGLVMVQA